MAKLYVHGKVVKEYTKEGFITYRLMEDGKWLKQRTTSKGWKLVGNVTEKFSDRLIQYGYQVIDK